MTYQELYEKMQECGLISGTWGHHLEFLALLISDENAGKEELLKLFLLYFALIDDGNVYMPLDRDKLTEKVNEKIDGLEVLIEEEADKKGKELPDEGVDSAKPAEVTEKLNRMEEVRAEFSGACDALSEIAGLDFVADCSLFCVEDNRLFTKRFFEDVEEIKRSAKRLFVPKSWSDRGVNYSALMIDPFELSDKQKEIVDKGLCNNLLVTGGPGTGKTTSIFFLLSALLEADPEKYDVYLAAPSGKAAARMKESIGKEIRNMKNGGLPELKKIASFQEYTIHRLLEMDLNNNGYVHNRKNRFPKNSVFVIDEASMIDVDLFAALLQAIPDEARVFILGDKDQLPSVECGAVFAELLEFVSDDNKVSLTESRRFSASSEIFQLAQAVNNGDILPVTDADWVPAAKFDIALPNPKRENPIYYYKDDPCGSKEMESISEKWYDAFYKDLPGLCSRLDPENAGTLDQISGILDSARILSANNEGVRGVNTINRTILKKKFAGEKRYSGFYPGELVMVIRNNKPLNLYNGDSGVAVTVPDADSKPVMYLMFKKETSLQLEDGKKDNRIFKRNGYIFYPAVLVNREDVVTAFAITIHKSQGSDYGNILVILPKRKGHPLLNRQIVYTAITRTKGTTYIVSNQENQEQAKKTRVKRNTGVI